MAVVLKPSDPAVEMTTVRDFIHNLIAVSKFWLGLSK
jgi:hypothetical protein